MTVADPGSVGAETTRPAGFGLDVFGLDDRMRLFSYVTAENRLAYLWVLRAFETQRANYHVLLHTGQVGEALTTLAAEHAECPDPAELELPRLLDALVEWGLLDRAQDGTRAATLAEYRNRHSVYQFTEAGYRAHRAVEQVLSASVADATCPGWCSPTCWPTCGRWLRRTAPATPRRCTASSTGWTARWPTWRSGPRVSTQCWAT